MSFLNAASLFWALPVIGAIIALYLLKIRRIDLKVPATFLWPATTNDVRANALFQRLRFSWLLLLQLLAAALIVIALAGPLHRSRGLVGAATVVVLDDSASMQATDVAPSRFVSGIERVKSLIGSLTGNDRMALIVAGARTAIIFPLTSDKAQMVRSMGAIAPTDARSNMGEALRLAAALVNGRPAAKIVVLSDGNFPAVTDFSPGRAELSYITIGTSHKNVAITAFNSSLSPNGQLLCFSAIHNYDSAPMPVKAVFTVDDRLVDARQITAPPDSDSYVTFKTPPTGRRATLTINSPGDILSSDNTATIYLKGAGTIRTLLVSTGDLFLQNALSLDPAVRLETASDVPDFELSSAKGAGRYDLVVFDNVPPRPVKAPAIWSLGVPDAQFGVRAVGISAHPAVLDWQRTDPVMNYVDLSQLNIMQAYRVAEVAGIGDNTLASGSDGPLVVSSHLGGKRTLYNAWNILDSDFPLRIGFPIFVANSVDWLTTGRARSAAERGGVMASTGQTFSVASSDPVVTLTAPDGTSRTITPTNGSAIIRSADRVGIYHIQGISTSTEIAVNLLDEGASDVVSKADLELSGTPLKASPVSNLMLSEIWRPIVCFVLLILTFEWWLFARRS